jgi:hypothetical protein
VDFVGVNKMNVGITEVVGACNRNGSSNTNFLVKNIGKMQIVIYGS